MSGRGIFYKVLIPRVNGVLATHNQRRIRVTGNPGEGNRPAHESDHADALRLIAHRFAGEAADEAVMTANNHKTKSKTSARTSTQCDGLRPRYRSGHTRSRAGG